MKKYSINFGTALLTFVLGLVVSWGIPKPKVTHHVEIKKFRLDVNCNHENLVVKQQPESGARLSILEAECGKFPSKFIFTMENVGPKVIKGYKVEFRQDYESFIVIRSAQSVTSSDAFLLRVGEMTTIALKSEFAEVSGCSTGCVDLKSAFWIRRIDFADGTHWESNLESN